MDVTTLSTKGQIVIPEKLRKGFGPGSAFSVWRLEGMIVLKPVEGLNADEKKELRELERIWKEVDKGAEEYSENDFFSAMRQW